MKVTRDSVSSLLEKTGFWIPPVCYAGGYFFGIAFFLIAAGIALFPLFLRIGRKRLLLISLVAGLAGISMAWRDTLPVTVTEIVAYADSEIMRLESGQLLRHDGTVPIKAGDQVRFRQNTLLREKGLPFLPQVFVVPDKGIRARLADFIRARSDSTILLAFATGLRFFTPEERSGFLKTGTMHVVAISAFHLGVLFLFIHLLGRLLILVPGLSSKRRLLLTTALKALVLFWYLSLTGWGTPTVRAAVFVLVLDLFLAAGLSAHPFWLYLVSLILTSAIVPGSMTSMSFVMSALCLFAVITLWNRVTRSEILNILILSIVISLLLLPISAELSGYLPLLSPLWNLAIVPAAGLLILLLLPVQILFPVLPAAATAVLLIPADKLAGIIGENLRYFASLSDPWLLPLVQNPPVIDALFYLSSLLAFLVAGRTRAVLIGLSLITAACYFHPFFATPGIERIRSLPGESYCVKETSGHGTIVETARYNFPSEYVHRKFDALPSTLERDLARCGITHLDALHLRERFSPKLLNELRRRPRFEKTTLLPVFAFPLRPPTPHPCAGCAEVRDPAALP